MDITEELKGGVLVIAATGRIDSNTAPALETMLPGRIETHPATVIDLGAVSYISSAGLRVLLKGAKVAKATGHRLVLSGLSPAVREVFDISGFSSIFAIEDDLTGALAALG